MIGVLVRPHECELASEFFELLKTPWEFWNAGIHYEVVLCTSVELPPGSPRLMLAFNGESTPMDEEREMESSSRTGGVVVSVDGKRVPVYGKLRTFSKCPGGLLTEAATLESVTYSHSSERGTILRIGYDLFEEVRILLTQGQPAENASIPTLEEHIGWLREWITRSGLPLLEIPPTPDGYHFIGCLTHDIDHPRLRNHWCDHTMLGFLHRATLGTLVDICRGRRSISVLWKNLWAACMLPFVHLGMASDSWAEFDRYLDIEAGHGSTFFVIPRSSDPGRTPEGAAPARRASAYGVNDLVPQLRRIVAAGGEVAVHGLDSWLDAEAGRREREQVTEAVQAGEIGVRMHWLYFDEQSPSRLEEAGFCYDSTFGYRETAGFRAGTTQAFKPPGARKLLELPLHIMDTALFYPSYLHLREEEAERLIWALLDEGARVGGVIIVNWHDRSIFPERQWDGLYTRLVRELSERGAWLPTVSQAAAWFGKRRAATFDSVTVANEKVTVRVHVDAVDSLPGMKLRIHKPRSDSFDSPPAATKPAQFVDVELRSTGEISVVL